MLVAEGFGQHIDKGYIYFAMAFSLGVEVLNMRLRAQGDAGRPAALGDCRRTSRRAGALQERNSCSEHAPSNVAEIRTADALASGHQRAWTLPMIASRGTGPQ